MSSIPSSQKAAEVNRPRSGHLVSVSWEDAKESDVSRGSRLQFEVAECVETKTITTTTTTKRSYPPLYVREPRSLQSLDAKEYPLATKPTPPELARFTFDLDDNLDSDVCSSFDDFSNSQSLVRSQDEIRPVSLSQPSRRPKSGEINMTQSEPGSEFSHDALSQHTSKLPTGNVPRRTTRSSSAAVSPHAATSRKLLRSTNAASSTVASDRYRRLGAGFSKDGRDGERPSRESAQSTYLATPDNSGIEFNAAERTSRFRSFRSDRVANDKANASSSQTTSLYDAASPTGSDSHTVFSNSVATPPIMDADTGPFADPDESLQQTVRSLPPRVLSNVGVLDASLPSPRLSPTLSAAHLPSNGRDDDPDLDDPSFSRQLAHHDLSWTNESHSIEDTDAALFSFSNSCSQREAAPGNFLGTKSTFIESRSMLEKFDAMPNEMKAFMMYQFLRRCTRKTLHMVAGVVNPALKCDFFKQLPLELSLHILSYLDFRDLCRAAQVSKHWRSIVDSNETGWKELFDRDGFELPLGELQKAITQGWGWQDPTGPGGCEVDLSLRNRMASTENDLIRSLKAETSTRIRSSKRKRGIASFPSTERSKRRASAQEVPKEENPREWPQLHKSEGPISAANAAAVAVPDPQIGVSSLRKLHLFKSLYRRHHMIRQSWTNGKVKPSHVAFTAHPRHVITCLQFDDDKIITGSDDTLIHVYDTKTGKLLKKLEGHEGGVWALQYEGNVLVSGSTDRSVRVWDIDKGLCTQVFYGHTSTVRCLQILMPTKTGKFENGKPVMMPPKPLIITGSRDNQLRVWRLPEPGSRRYIQNGPPANDSECPYFIRILSGHTSSVRSIAAHGDTLVSGSYDSTVRVWRISTGEALHVLHGHNQRVYSVVLDVKRNRCISGSMDSYVKIWDLSECIQDLLTDLSGVWQVKFDERRCVAAVQRDNLTYVEILDFGAVRDGVPPEELGKRKLLNAPEVQALIEEEM
ncbi:WD40 repeat-like-containing domain protein [Niveomyces insectorum RCEF 264]|uniref:WD40 repeat-like-containing domain protein n=1 Tax=Niveomyces insectorum RCEF 264 TaxID=1081102 RepID=A0A167PWJ2_9HYPO|nr:WD40 repeat-like-containing domain protein [Niveomyces insectorum RCEF 264]